MFLHLCVSHSVHGGGVYAPLGRHPLPRDGQWSGQYASYWNACLLIHIFAPIGNIAQPFVDKTVKYVGCTEMAIFLTKQPKHVLSLLTTWPMTSILQKKKKKWKKEIEESDAFPLRYVIDFTGLFCVQRNHSSKAAPMATWTPSPPPNCIFIARKIAAVITLHTSGLV